MRLKLFAGAAAVVLVVAVLAAGLTAFWLRRSGSPVREGERRLAGLEAPVEVRFDGWGVPHVLARSETDAVAALGYLHANDRFTQMELGRRAAYGRLAEILGPAVVEVDVHFRTLRLGATAEAMAEAASPRSRRWLEAYARGVNAWLEERGTDLPPGLRLLGAEPEPWREAHSLAFALLMFEDLSFWNGRSEEERFRWLRSFGLEAVRELLDEPDLHAAPEILALARPSEAGDAEVGGSGSEGEAAGESEDDGAIEAGESAGAALGSNNWAVGPSRAAAGAALLANDPHLGLHLPSVWYQVMLRSPTYEVAGMSLPGTPGVVIGRGPRVAWAFTNVMLDDHDVFFERLDETGERYLRGDRWLPLEVHEETIRVRGGEPREITLRATDVGPLLEEDVERGLPPRSLAWTAYLPGDPLAALAELSRAASVDEALEALDPYVGPAQNLVAAFAGGELLYTVIGRVPQRRGEVAPIVPPIAPDDPPAEAPPVAPAIEPLAEAATPLGPGAALGRLPSPGWNPAYGWDGLRPRATNPLVVSPSDDLLVTANHDVRPPGYASSLAADFFSSHRARRIAERLAERDDWDAASFAALQSDARSLFARDLTAALEDDYAGDAGRAYEALRGWDGAMGPRGPAALYDLAERHLIDAVFADEAETFGIRPFGSRELLLRLARGELDERWFDDAGTAERESRRETVAGALAEAWREGRERWGEDVAGWSYGELHSLTLRHRLDAVPILGAWARRGPYPVAGSATSIAAFAASRRGKRLEVTHGPSMRWIVDWGQPERAFAGLPGGQSGHPADPHYDDRIAPFLAGEPQPAPFSEGAILASTISRLRLVP